LTASLGNLDIKITTQIIGEGNCDEYDETYNGNFDSGEECSVNCGWRGFWMASFDEIYGNCICEHNPEDDFICDSFENFYELGWTTYKITTMPPTP
jgi:hypothetical protein